MRYLILLAMASVGSFAGGAGPLPGLSNVHTVYLLPMGNSLDQYLANQLTANGVFQVVTDPSKADAVFTDKIGAALEDKLDELYPSDDKKAKDEENKDSGAPAKRFGSITRGRGTLFLVDLKTRAVVWSVFTDVKSPQPRDTNRRAGQIVKKLRLALTGKQS